MRPEIGIGVIGFGWMGQAHARSYLRIPTLFQERLAEPVLAACADPLPARRELAAGSFGFREVTADWSDVVADPRVDVVVVAAPNMLHVDVVEAACHAGKHVFCEKPVGGTPGQTARAAAAAREAGVITGVGYNYRFAPLVIHGRSLVAEGGVGDVSHFRARFFSMYGSDPLGLLTWRFLDDEGGYGVSSDLLSHAIDLAHALVGPVRRLVGTRATAIAERPLPRLGEATHYGRGAPGDPTGPVTNEDYAAMLVEFDSGATGVFEASRTLVGPESQLAFDLYGTKGALGWSLERLNELQVSTGDGYTTVFGGDRFPYHGAFVPGNANAIGFEDLVAIEDFEFLHAVARGERHEPGFPEALAVVAVQDALVRSWESGAWQDVVPVSVEVRETPATRGVRR
jgi:predicted dehydrogenase